MKPNMVNSKVLFVLTVALLPLSQISLAKPQSANAAPPATSSLLHRQYKDGETVKYHMKGKNEAWAYEIDSIAVVKKNADGIFVEQIAWSNLLSNGTPMGLPAESANFRQELSLDPGFMMKIPDFSKVAPAMVGPMADFMTFYTDLWLAGRSANLAKAGDHAYIKVGGPNSWADGYRMTLGQDSIDFDLTVLEINRNEGTAKLLVRHVPPQEPKVGLPVEWMKSPVADTQNNWVEVEKADGKYIAEVGKETFDVEITVSLNDGKILKATMNNPVKAIRRQCTDAALTQCGEATPRNILRQVEIELRP
jgi:hypothetical protein